MKSIDARIVKRHFLRSGGETDNIFLFENMPEPDRSRLADRFELESTSEPVVVARLYPEGLLILCSRHIFLDLPSGLRKVAYSSIDDVTIDKRREVILLGRHKHEWRELVVKLATGEELLLETEPGVGFWGLFNAFRFQAHRLSRLRRKHESENKN